MVFVDYPAPIKLSALRMIGLFHIPLNTVKTYLGLPTLCEQTLERWALHFHETRTVVPNYSSYLPRGRQRAVTGDEAAFVEGRLVDDSTLYCPKLRLKLYHHTGKWISVPAMQRLLHDKLGMSNKQPQRLHQKRSTKKRANFTYHIAQYPPLYLVFADESAVLQRGTERRNGWAKSGFRPDRIISKVNGKNYSCLLFVSLEGVLECTVKVGSFKRKQFVWVLKNLVFPQMNRFPGRNSVLVLDNATIHHSAEIRKLACRFGVKLEYNAPYLPNYCPVEKGFSKMKAALRKNHRLLGASGDKVLEIIEDEARRAMDGETMKRLYRSCGYF